MCAAAIESEDEVPSLLWGLNPIFSSYARLYIKDILEIKESKQVPGIFFYNRHPIRQVDIFGTVVLIKEKDSFYICGVDDGTGVISCTCWKNALTEKKKITLSGMNLTDLIRNLQIAIRKKTILEIGDLIRVRGCIRIYRQQREIKASVYYKVDDPMYETQISRMLELPRLYRDIYDKIFQFPEETQCNHGALDELGSVMNLSKKIRDFLLRNKIQSFYMQELETIEDLVTLAKRGVSVGDQTDARNISESKSFMEAIKLLQKNGVLFQKSNTSQNMYHVSIEGCIVFLASHYIYIQLYAEKGCHLRHILSCIQQNYNPYITEAVVHCLLDWLEINSEVVTTMEEYYTVF
uniref:CST complex subunit STN1 n=1 Tax=Pseudonaja textilis TaxID=8673 RepID=A0A670XYI7_PSETE